MRVYTVLSPATDLNSLEESAPQNARDCQDATELLTDPLADKDSLSIDVPKCELPGFINASPTLSSSSLDAHKSTSEVAGPKSDPLIGGATSGDDWPPLMSFVNGPANGVGPSTSARSPSRAWRLTDSLAASDSKAASVVQALVQEKKKRRGRPPKYVGSFLVPSGAGLGDRNLEESDGANSDSDTSSSFDSAFAKRRKQQFSATNRQLTKPRLFVGAYGRPPKELPHPPTPPPTLEDVEESLRKLHYDGDLKTYAQRIFGEKEGEKEKVVEEKDKVAEESEKVLEEKTEECPDGDSEKFAEEKSEKVLGESEKGPGEKTEKYAEESAEVVEEKSEKVTKEEIGSQSVESAAAQKPESRLMDTGQSSENGENVDVDLGREAVEKISDWDWFAPDFYFWHNAKAEKNISINKRKGVSTRSKKKKQSAASKIRPRAAKPFDVNYFAPLTSQHEERNVKNLKNEDMFTRQDSAMSRVGKRGAKPVRIEEFVKISEITQLPRLKCRKLDCETADNVYPQRINVSCRHLAPLKLSKCRDCQTEGAEHAWCQFMGFRKILCRENGPETFGWLTADESDIMDCRKDYWMPIQKNGGSAWNETRACYVLQNISTELERMIENELWLIRCLQFNDSESLDRMPGFRHSVQVRELCDVCATTIFNLHLMCDICGFIACIDCIRDRNMRRERLDCSKKKKHDLDQYGWPICRQKRKVPWGTKGGTHHTQNMILAQIIPDPKPHYLATVLTVERQVRQVMERNRIAPGCVCAEAETSNLRCFCAKPEPISAADNLPAPLTAEEQLMDEIFEGKNDVNNESGLNQSEIMEIDKLEKNEEENFEENVVLAEPRKTGGLDFTSYFEDMPKLSSSAGALPLDDVFSDGMSDENSQDGVGQRCDVVRGLAPANGNLESTPQRRPPWIDGEIGYLCDGGVLVLENPENAQNLHAFQKHWQQSKPVIVGNVHLQMNASIWTPDYFRAAKERFERRNITGLIIDCRTGVAVNHMNQNLSLVNVDQFWEGFSDSLKLPQWPDGKKMYLKLKDYPGKSTFKEALPDQYKEFCDVLPLPEYTAPEMDLTGRGVYNLVTSLPADRYVRPDLGPKMYTAYGMIYDTKKASTCLHLDISDAVNVMANVTVPSGVGDDYQKEVILEHCRKEGVSDYDMKRVESNWKEAGAIWTIFLPQDTEMIKQWVFECKAEAKFIQELPKDFRDQMNNCKIDDPIHDQTLFLTGDLQRELRKRTSAPGPMTPDGEVQRDPTSGVQGFTFVQMLGDAVFIPAGAAHQVQNLLSCIKVAEDFVSPEGVANSAKIANEFRYLTREHANREDKLQSPLPQVRGFDCQLAGGLEVCGLAIARPPTSADRLGDPPAHR